jgi:frataxin
MKPSRVRHLVFRHKLSQRSTLCPTFLVRPPLPSLGVSRLPSAAHRAFSTAAFHELAEHTLSHVEASLATLEDTVEDLDISNAMGVLTIHLGGKGTYVLNKQAPNEQIWWSSPLSGPKRYHWDVSAGRWKNTRDGHDMLDLLSEEIKQLTHREIRFTAT